MIVTYRTDDEGVCEIVHFGSSPQPQIPNTKPAVIEDRVIGLGRHRYDEEYGAIVDINEAEMEVLRKLKAEKEIT